ncbi:uncharacterized protein LOC132731333 [Ruditapes philippinarum]|uniref:uncharacterized protein LOC132731333 n=1 Tax=Ruditapes philippinarum TaxID=129788 RepID=UPI00295BDD3E|nr:uncharacterized protein LOC132731333 [Ruditapes philippinarum]
MSTKIWINARFPRFFHIFMQQTHFRKTTTMEETPKQLFKVDPCKCKKTTRHEKGKPLNLPNRSGKVSVQYIENDRKRRQALSGRRTGLFKKAYELHKMTRKYVKLQVGEDYWCSEPDKNNSLSTGDNAQTTTDDNPLLSPSRFNIEEINTKDVATQCNLMDGLPSSNDSANSSEQCRLCGGLFADDSKGVKDLWLGCDEPECKYWLHATCLLGKSPKITVKFVRTLPFRCNLHK